MITLPPCLHGEENMEHLQRHLAHSSRLPMRETIIPSDLLLAAPAPPAVHPRRNTPRTMYRHRLLLDIPIRRQHHSQICHGLTHSQGTSDRLRMHHPMCSLTLFQRRLNLLLRFNPHLTESRVRSESGARSHYITLILQIILYPLVGSVQRVFKSEHRHLPCRRESHPCH